MKAKTKFGMGMTKKKKTKSRMLSVAKRGGILLLLPLLEGIGSVEWRVNDTKAVQRQLEEMKSSQSCYGRTRTLSRSVQTRQRSIAEEKKNVKKMKNKDARGCHHQFTVVTFGEAYANIVFPRCLHA
jgi:hypothetical protein